MADQQQNQAVSKTDMAIARGSLRRRIAAEQSRLGEMIRRGNHKGLSYQSGLVDGLNIAASLSALLDTNTIVEES